MYLLSVIIKRHLKRFKNEKLTYYIYFLVPINKSLFVLPIWKRQIDRWITTKDNRSSSTFFIENWMSNGFIEAKLPADHYHSTEQWFLQFRFFFSCTRKSLMKFEMTIEIVLFKYTHMQQAGKTIVCQNISYISRNMHIWDLTAW